MFYDFVIFLARGLCYLFFRIKFEGIENIPTDKGFILCGNHRTYADPVFVAAKSPVRLNFMAKEELFTNRFFGGFIRKLNAFPVARGKGDTSTLEKAVEMLKDKKPLLMFIEGSRSKDGVPGRPRSGTAVIAASAGVGIVPFSIDYGDKLRFRTKIAIKFHPLISCEELAVNLDEPATIRDASKRIMRVITSGLSHIPPKGEK